MSSSDYILTSIDSSQQMKPNNHKFNKFRKTISNYDEEEEEEQLLRNEGNFTRGSSRHRKRFLRLISRDEHKVMLERHGTPTMSQLKSWYHTMLDQSWWKLLIGFLLAFILTHIVFGVLFYADYFGISGIAEDDPSLLKFYKCFCLSVQTLSTIGFGSPLSPNSTYAQGIVVLEAFLGFIYSAVLTATVVTKIARPTRLVRRILFSEVAVINQVSRHWFCEPNQSIDNGRIVVGRYPVLTLRVANTRKSMLTDPALRVYLLRKESEDGRTVAQLKRDNNGVIPPRSRVKEVMHELDFELNNQVGRAKTLGFALPHLALPWTVTHTLRPGSPLYHLQESDLNEDPDNLFEIIVVLDGVDEAISMNVEGRWSYLPHEIVWDAEFHRMVKGSLTKGIYEVNYARLSDYQTVDDDERISVKRREEEERLEGLKHNLVDE
ncbi:K+ channel protein [Planoprotostelium fungivorum]|uniref:K+ channel protein n=1 Tax=Planoprotostelium fungivorum TaxID=1890364 RepID=A0A2P6NWI7_9EUKA|nr:K+ channel protein [Planoprotostelium fungivorum]